MRTVTLPFRKAVYQALQGITYNDVLINVFEEDVQETPAKKVSLLTIGGSQVKVWIILTNQTSNDNSSKQCRNDETGLQVQVKAEFPSNKGNSIIPESIMDLVADRLFNYTGLFKGIEMDYPFTLWKLDYIGDRNLNYSGDSSRVWMKNLDVLGHITQAPNAVNNSGFEYAFDFALS